MNIKEKWVSQEELNGLISGSGSHSSGIILSQISGVTPGSIPFADATGYLTEDNANLFWDAAEANLGIGTNVFGATMEQGIQIATGVAPTANVADTFAFYSADFGGNACPHFRTENGTVIGLNQSLFTTDSVVFAALTVGNLGLHILDTGGDHYLTIKPNEDLSASRVLSIITGDAARTITLSGNPTLANWFDQAVKQASSPIFATVKLSGLTDGYVPYHVADATGLANSPIFIDGTKVGIGVSPAGPLHVKGSVNQTLTLERSSSTVGHGAGAFFRLLDDGANIHDYATIFGGIEANADGAEKGYLSFWTANPGLGERVRITAPGNVGIMTVDPYGRLEIEDAGCADLALLKITADDGNPYALVIGNDTYSVNDLKGLVALVADTGGAYLVMQSDGGTPFLFLGVDANGIHIDAAGKVGMGAPSPDPRFYVLEAGGSWAANITHSRSADPGYGLFISTNRSNADTYGLGVYSAANIRYDFVVKGDGGVHAANLKSGINQGAAGAAAGELWVDTGDQTIKLGT